MSEKKTIHIGRRITRAVFNGLMIGVFGGTGLYLLTRAVNILAGEVVLDPIAFLMLGLGGSTVAAIGIELSADIQED